MCCCNRGMDGGGLLMPFQTSRSNGMLLKRQNHCLFNSIFCLYHFWVFKLRAADSVRFRGSFTNADYFFSMNYLVSQLYLKLLKSVLMRIDMATLSQCRKKNEEEKRSQNQLETWWWMYYCTAHAHESPFLLRSMISFHLVLCRLFLS